MTIESNENETVGGRKGASFSRKKIRRFLRLVAGVRFGRYFTVSVALR